MDQWGIHKPYRHEDSHGGIALSLGRGVVYGTSTQQNFNTCSSTEAELVAVDDCMGQILWTRYFSGTQECQVDDAVMYQDNLSVMFVI